MKEKDPAGTLQQTLEIYRPEEQRWVVAATFEGNVTVRAEPFDAIAIDLNRWWL
ncbi:MAG TPA: hypothetical protein VEB21_11580 [Terriglobales bacterium]|nr:hypothetical protein [Terriglobales bacterium]